MIKKTQRFIFSNPYKSDCYHTIPSSHQDYDRFYEWLESVNLKYDDMSDPDQHVFVFENKTSEFAMILLFKANMK